MKHAYLIVAHNNYEILKRNIEILDSEETGFFIHIDLKSENFPMKEIEQMVKLGKITFVKRRSVLWGDISIVECELDLLEAAAKKKFDYYHLISGVDLAIKSKKYINDFFEKYNGFEFIHFCDDDENDRYKKRCQNIYYTKKLRGKLSLYNKIYNKISVKAQRIIKYSINKELIVKKGSNWFSITDKLAKNIVKERAWIEATFKNTLCADEHYVQSLIATKRLNVKIYAECGEGAISNSLREIDWERGKPYIYKKEDLKELQESKNIFARKFDEKVDMEIVNLLVERSKVEK